MMKAFRYSLGTLLLALILVSCNYVIPVPETNSSGETNIIESISDVPGNARDDILSPLTALSSGEIHGEVTFPLTGGLDSNNSITLPPRANINEARFDLTSQPLENITIPHNHDYTDTVNNSAWKGAFTGTSPTSPPADYMDAPYDGVDYNNVVFSDDQYAEIILNDGKSPYQLFEFTVNETSVKEIYLFFEGLGYYRVGMANYHYNVTLYLYNQSFNQWDNVAQKNERQPPAGDFIMSYIIDTNHTDFIDDQNKLYLMAVGPYDPTPDTRDEYLRCDRAFINVKTLENIYPSKVTLDIGNDGNIEWTKNEIFSGEVTISDDVGLAASLQEISDNGSELDDIFIPIAIGSGTGGTIIIDNIFISFTQRPYNSPPGLSRLIPPDFLEFAEDSSDGNNLLDLSDFFEDDDQVNLSFEIVLNHKEINASIDPDKIHMDFTSEKNYFGTQTFQVKAVDRGVDGIPNTGDELSILSNIFNVTVYPTNDEPVLLELNGTPVLPEQIEAGLILDVWEDLPETFIYYCFDVDGDIPSYSIIHLPTTPSWIELVPDTDNTSVFKLMIHAINENIGWFNSTIIISDENGSEPLSLEVNISIFVHNTNDRPRFTLLGENAPEDNSMRMDVLERNWLNFTIEATDPDPNDRLTFFTNRTDGQGDDDIPGMELIPDPDNMKGEIKFHAYVAPGIYPVNLSVSDLAGTFDWVNLKITVMDVNEFPVAGILRFSGGEQNLSVVIVAEGFVDPDGDPLIYDWDMGDDMGAYLGLELMKVNHSYLTSGNYTVKLGLIDGRGGSLEVNISITVTAPLGDSGGNENESDNDETPDPEDNNGKDSVGEEKSFLESGGMWLLLGIILLLLVAGIGFISLKKTKKDDRTPKPDNVGILASSTPSNESSSDPMKPDSSGSSDEDAENLEPKIKSENLEATDESTS